MATSVVRVPNIEKNVESIPTRSPLTHMAEAAQARSDRDGHVGTKPFERALLSLNAAVGASLPSPRAHAHPLLRLASASPSLRIAWGTLHPAIHPDWLAQRENVDPRVKPGQSERTGFRSERKTQQIESLAALAVLLASDLDREGLPLRIVDFAGGSGPLALPLAALLPHCTLVIVDVKQRSLDLAATRAAAAGLRNVETWLGDIAEFDGPFGVGLALHACGEASDLAMLACVRAGARFVISPCCVGKLSSATLDPYKFNATGQNAGRVSYPRSTAVAAVVGTVAYDAIACAGDFAEKSQLVGARGALRRLCKCWLEHDRLLWAAERGYEARVCRMVPETASPKNHILYGWLASRPPPPGVRDALSAAVADGTLADAAALLRVEPSGAAASGDAAGEVRASAALAASEWEPAEVAEVDQLVSAWAVGGDEEPLVVTASSSRRRRLVHYVAESHGLAHRTEAKKSVIIRHRGPCRPAADE